MKMPTLEVNRVGRSAMRLCNKGMPEEIKSLIKYARILLTGPVKHIHTSDVDCDNILPCTSHICQTIHFIWTMYIDVFFAHDTGQIMVYIKHEYLYANGIYIPTEERADKINVDRAILQALIRLESETFALMELTTMHIREQIILYVNTFRRAVNTCLNYMNSVKNGSHQSKLTAYICFCYGVLNNLRGCDDFVFSTENIYEYSGRWSKFNGPITKVKLEKYIARHIANKFLELEKDINNLHKWGSKT